MNPKSAAEIIPVTVDFREDMADGEYLTSASAVLSVPGTMTAAPPTFTANAVSTVLSGGAEGAKTRLTVTGTSNLNNEFAHDEFVTVDSSNFAAFDKLASDEFPIEVDFSQKLFTQAGPDHITALTVKAYDNTGTDVTGSIIASSAAASPLARIEVTGGTVGMIYRISAQITTSRGYLYEAVLTMRVNL